HPPQGTLGYGTTTGPAAPPPEENPGTTAATRRHRPISQLPRRLSCVRTALPRTWPITLATWGPVSRAEQIVPGATGANGWARCASTRQAAAGWATVPDAGLHDRRRCTTPGLPRPFG